MKKLLIILLLFTGCNYKELNNIAIVSGISIDYDNKYKISIMVSEDKNTIYYTNGKSISEAIDNLSLPKQLYLGHLDTVIISDKASKKINSITDYFLRNPETSKRFYLIMTKDKASNILKYLSKLNPFPFNKKSLDINSNQLSNSITFSKFIETYLKKGIDSYIPIVEIKNKNLTTNKLGLFKKNKLITYTNDLETKGINTILGNSNELIIHSNDFITILKNIKVNKKVKIKKYPIIYIDIKANGYIEEMDSHISNKNIEKKLESQLKKMLIKSINKTKQYNVDTLGFGNLIYKKYPHYKYKLKNTKTIIKPNIKIKRINYEKVE